jgi:2,3-bisphosphoglycerate-dependent phosphoglycerate mutase
MVSRMRSADAPEGDAVARLVLIRHGESTWNAQNRFTGWVDVPLSPRGREDARRAARLLGEHGVVVDVCFTSLLIRAIETAVICLTEGDGLCAGRSPVLKHDARDPDWRGWDRYEGDEDGEVPVFMSQALDERCYGTLQGLDKRQTAERVGQETVRRWRRSYSTRPPGGESLADTAARTTPFLEGPLMNHLRAGYSALVSAHGNSLRSLVMSLDGLDERQVAGLEVAMAVPLIYEIDAHGKITGRSRLAG